MKRLALTLVAGAFGSLMMLPTAYAQSDRDMNNDSEAIQQDHAAVQRDKQERREDVKRGRYGAAAREQSEIDQRHADMQERKSDLNNDLANRYGDRHGDDDDNRQRPEGSRMPRRRDYLGGAVVYLRAGAMALASSIRNPVYCA